MVKNHPLPQTCIITMLGEIIIICYLHSPELDARSLAAFAQVFMDKGLGGMERANGLERTGTPVVVKTRLADTSRVVSLGIKALGELSNANREK